MGTKAFRRGSGTGVRMMRGAALVAGVFAILGVRQAVADGGLTEVSIYGNDFYLNGSPTYAGRTYGGTSIQGLLFNSRMIQGIFDDYNPNTRGRWVYPDTGVWDPERNTDEFVAQMATWKSYGLLAFTIGLQGGSPEGYSVTQPWDTGAINPDGSLRPDYMARLQRILDQADALGMVAIVNFFYFGQDERLTDEAAVQNAVVNATQWILWHGYRNVLIDVANECDLDLGTPALRYDHAILQPARISELIDLVKATAYNNGQWLLVGTSFTGTPTDDVIAHSDFVLPHGNVLDDPNQVADLVATIQQLPSYHDNMPIVFNEDDHFAFDQSTNNMVMATQSRASWGYFDPGAGNYWDGFQCPPVNWGLTSGLKQAFFNKVYEVTGGP